ncbi:hypothetical protein KSF_056580 [Reticulibacter mediterranei]|uniref:Uncharacterized protein n=1 Tax=Reticulibacter mediterranei TaxID=2778369 RepID=A0A8J3IRL4_9CHLR|nr:hypothetical protein [Reticulibacter mediterranei]GHO95610.1 hypothetical protein KSF_056580 [Reticulibacter mediterranei]
MSTVPQNNNDSILLRLWPWVATFCLLVTLVSAVATAIMYITHASSSQTTTKQVTYGSPITITKGGTYSGNWQSTKPDMPAVKIATGEPVLIINSHIKGPGDLIQALDTTGSNITVRNSVGLGINPGVVGKTKGVFLHVNAVAKIVVENCDMQEISGGIMLDSSAGNKTSDQTVVIRYNRSLNLDARRSDGKGGYLPYQQGQPGAYFLQIQHLDAVPGVNIGWNEMINGPSNGTVESAITLNQSSGTADSPLLIHDNYVQGFVLISPQSDDHVQIADTVTQRSAWQQKIAKARVIIGSH